MMIQSLLAVSLCGGLVAGGTALATAQDMAEPRADGRALSPILEVAQTVAPSGPARFVVWPPATGHNGLRRVWLRGVFR